MRSADWLEIDEALHAMLSAVHQCGAEDAALNALLGRTLAEDIVSPVDQPPWDNSAMDGFAARGGDVAGASVATPVVLRVVDDIPAGAFPSVPLEHGQAARIMTGAPIPQGADSVIRIEHTRAAADGVAVLNDRDAGRNIRRRGEDVRTGQRVLEAGRVIRPAEVGVLALVGRAHARVTRLPRVAVLATGNELAEAGSSEALQAGTHIINSNSPALGAALQATGCTPVQLGIARDELDDLRGRIDAALDADALITTAGASVGEHDLVKDALEAAACRVLFWRVKIRPGSPFSFGLIERAGAPPLPVFGLPGNPVSALVTYEVLVRPVLRRMLGRTALFPRVLEAVAGEAIRSPTGLVRLLRVRLDEEPGAAPRVYLTGAQGSGILTSVAAADGLLIVPLDVETIGVGERVRVLPLRAADDAQVVAPRFRSD